jgi:hypothetical protein
MNLMDRRRFLIASAATAASLKSFAQTSPAFATLTLHPNRPGPTIPLNFVGLSYETQQLSEAAFFSPANSGLIAQFRALAPHGVLRIGGNTSDIGWWKPTPASTMPPLPANVVLSVPPGEKSPLDLAYAVTPEAVRNLRGFLNATGWTCLYGINLGTNTPALAAEQAVFVAKTLGPKLEYFQIGNEPDGFPHRFRDKATWNANTYLDDWFAAVNAIRTRVPDARFGLPDVAGNMEWFATIVDRLAGLADAPHIAALSHHYYFTGPPSNPKANIADLLRADPKVAHNAGLALAAAAKLGTRFRMTEGNTCYRGGKPGLSDVFAASLWAADYLLTLASLGYAGANLHGGDGQMVANSLGGRLPGDDLVKDDPASHPHPYYTPIAHIGDKYVAEPVFYGMKFAQQFAGATMIPVDFDPGTVNATAFGARLEKGAIAFAIINKDPNQDLSLDIDFDATQMVKISWMFLGETSRLRADGLQSSRVYLDGALGGAGDVVPKRDHFEMPAEQSIKRFSVPRASALFITGSRVL